MGQIFSYTTTSINPNQQISFPTDQNKNTNPSNDDSENNKANNNLNKRVQLTHVHLRKAKLIFFYQRYPNCSVLEGYFPDVQFNEHNTAQLLSWFSNFREYYYMEMEKFAKRALEEGVNCQEEAFVTSESKIYKQINQHFNKNNVFKAPENFQFVVQKTLREFFTALQQQKNLEEPSWEELIKEVIKQLDEPIPNYFRESKFDEMVENI
uniref:Prospero domain-containing protein n=1 Tax=Meloidogyne incognita TaxID=6306 RepID=A0A914L0C2_MELIC